LVTAKNKREFITTWNEHINQLGELAYSLPAARAKVFFDTHKELLQFVKEAADFTFVDCEFYRLTPKEHQCVEGDCYNGCTEATKLFGNCCMKCPKAMKCDAGCMKTEELKCSIVKREVKKSKCR